MLWLLISSHIYLPIDLRIPNYRLIHVFYIWKVYLGVFRVVTWGPSCPLQREQQTADPVPRQGPFKEEDSTIYVCVCSYLIYIYIHVPLIFFYICVCKLHVNSVCGQTPSISDSIHLLLEAPLKDLIYVYTYTLILHVYNAISSCMC